MDENKKHYIVTSITLGVIASLSAGLIALTDLITKDQIKQNEINKINAGIASIFGDSISIKSENDLSSYQYTSHYYEVSDSNNERLGYAFRTTGSNMYGKISLIIGYTEEDHSFKSLEIVTDEQTYASTLEDNYIDLVNKGERQIEDVSCGATYGAKLVRDMINDAYIAALDLWGINHG